MAKIRPVCIRWVTLGFINMVSKFYCCLKCTLFWCNQQNPTRSPLFLSKSL
ncbi:Hypothetical protein I595_1647 [Croceitalea dokdonensis DOKDO 023]|uniref:Uncharacterized protein n=1 Tax=Croceitalea dokdonensis DOKDO 023 TaxID=1300341 RepID=A0A0P7AVQ5_9FLAO|nr:Hypothetical protein I595_1647 [Croceitalea dokdonensis DOKDO 023]